MDANPQTDDTAPAARTPRERLTAHDARRWVLNVRSGLRRAAPGLDAVNVFPVADGDTGTNMFLTLDQGLRRGPRWDPADPAGSIEGLARSILLSARGNSGVILAQLVAGAASEVVRGAHGTGDGLDGAGVARALSRADASAWEAVAAPERGTILSVSRAASRAANRAARKGGDLVAVARAALQAATAGLARTPEELAALRTAGVVDAGAAGYVIVLHHLVLACGVEPPPVPELARPRPGASLPVAGLSGAAEEDAVGPPPADRCGGSPAPEPGESTVEIVLGLTLSEASARRSDRHVRRLRRKLADLGDSVVVAGAGRHWRVHVHVADEQVVPRVQALCERAGEVGEVRTESLFPHHRGTAPLALLVAANEEPLADVLRAGGAHVVASGPGRRAVIGDLVAAAEACRAQRVVFLPGDPQLLLPAQEAARQLAARGVWLELVDAPTLQAVVAAVAVWDPAEEPERAVKTLTAAAAVPHTGAVRAVEGGRFVGMVGDDRVGEGEDLLGVLSTVIAALPSRGVELATVITGEGSREGLGRVVESTLRLRRRNLDVQVLAGGPEVYPVLVGLE
ncbi:hypothetical protein SAMN05445756_1737 [Kytococcus aerolatus]|uniref:DhaL domain-containing protein n=1 Tax=Kytococcus aerolatus TaxID=592308 RepID=A0A212U1L9_9MICO|nr:DAK2 domain-containing protein [Kytococcus aerolatus]SNC72128.1 hypothetical protein SAMN05445756_1737 [Kytococcus aerolatus]